MKKKGVLSVLCLLLLCIGGCGRPEYSDRYSVGSLYSDRQLVLKLRNKSSAQPGVFQLEEPLENETLQKALPDQAECVQLQNGWFLSMANDNGTTNQYYLNRDPSPGEEQDGWYGYRISGLYGQIHAKDGVDVSILLFPLHYLKEQGVSLYLDTDYEVDCTWDEVTAFYENAGWYDLSVEDGSIQIKGLRHEPDERCQRNGFAMGEDIYPLTLRYREESGKAVLRVEYEGDITQHAHYGIGQPSPTAEAWTNA